MMADRPGRRAWRSRGASVVITTLQQQSSQDNESDIMEARPFLGRTSSASSSSATATYVPGRIVAKANRFCQGVVSQTLGGAAAQKKKKRDSTLLHHHQHRRSSSKNITDAVHVQVPLKLMFYTAAVFLVLPLTIFIWKELHLHPPAVATVSEKNNHHPTDLHDRFPTWMDQEQSGISPQQPAKGHFLKGGPSAAAAAVLSNTKSSSEQATPTELQHSETMKDDAATLLVAAGITDETTAPAREGPSSGDEEEDQEQQNEELNEEESSDDEVSSESLSSSNEQQNERGPNESFTQQDGDGVQIPRKDTTAAEENTDLEDDRTKDQEETLQEGSPNDSGVDREPPADADSDRRFLQ